MTLEAAVSLSPVPPAFSESRKTCSVRSFWKRSTSASRRLLQLGAQALDLARVEIDVASLEPDHAGGLANQVLEILAAEQLVADRHPPVETENIVGVEKATASSLACLNCDLQQQAWSQAALQGLRQQRANAEQAKDGQGGEEEFRQRVGGPGAAAAVGEAAGWGLLPGGWQRKPRRK